MTKIVLESDLVSVDWLKNHLKFENLLVLDATIGKIIDVESSTKAKLIPNALFFDIKNKLSDTKSQFPNTFPSETQFETEVQILGINEDTAIIIYDDRGIYSSARAWWLFKSFGHTNVAVLDGGLPEWILKGGRVVQEYAKTSTKGNFKSNLNSNAYINIKTLQKIIKNKSNIIIDARSSERFQCEVPEPREGLRRGIIPGSSNIPFLSILEKGKFKPKQELKSIFNTLISNEAKVVFSCGSGITACVLALGATLIGYHKMTIYDGSWTEYGTLIKE